MLEKIKLISLEGLQTFLSNIQAWVEKKLEVLNKKIDKQIFQGTKSELAAAIEAGLVDDKTLIVLTDAEEQTEYVFSSDADILALFPEYK